MTDQQVGTVIQRIGRRYLLRDDRGGKFWTESDQSWPVGVRVISSGGVIIAKAGAAPMIKGYQV